MHNPPLARLGTWAHANRMAVIVAWAVFAIGLGIFAPKLEHALSGAMWEVDGSDSLAARDVIDREFGGLSSQSAAVVVWSDTLAADDPAFQAHVAEATAAIAEEPAFGPAMATCGVAAIPVQQWRLQCRFFQRSRCADVLPVRATHGRTFTRFSVGAFTARVSKRQYGASSTAGRGVPRHRLPSNSNSPYSRHAFDDSQCP